MLPSINNLYPQTRNGGLPRETLSDLYRAKYHMPLDGESHERFIATKVPVRKNKDFRPRFRNYSFGYPTYKKDNYMRHWYNFIDVLRNNEAPLLRYAKIWGTSFLLGLFYNSFGGYKGNTVERNNMLDWHKINTSSNYVKRTLVGSALQQAFYSSRKPAGMFACLSTFYFFLVARFQGFEYSLSQSLLRASLLFTPLLVLLKFDRPVVNFWYKSAGFAFIIYPLFYTLLVNKSSVFGGRSSANSEKYYIKGVSPQEISKIEYEDSIQLYAKLFEIDNSSNMYDNQYYTTPEKYLFKSAPQ